MDTKDEVDNFRRRHLARLQQRKHLAGLIEIEGDDVVPCKFFCEQPDATLIVGSAYSYAPAPAVTLALEEPGRKSRESSLEIQDFGLVIGHGERHSSQMPQQSSSSTAGRPQQQQADVCDPARILG